MRGHSYLVHSYSNLQSDNLARSGLHMAPVLKSYTVEIINLGI
jgi:hypothetical protein